MGAEVGRSVQLLILQSTPFCNINCTYCYLPNRENKAVMSEAVLEATFSNIANCALFGERLKVLWHAGEPMVLPIEYYERAVKIVRSYVPAGTKLKLAMQTNATLLDRDWCAFFRDKHIELGISLDGPKHLHDAARKTRRGSGTYDRVMTSVGLLKDEGVKFHVITVLTSDALSQAGEIFDFFALNGIRSVNLNIEEAEGAHSRPSIATDTPVSRFEGFLRTLYERSYGQREIEWVREIDRPMTALLGNHFGEVKNNLTEPFATTTVDYEGNFSFFSPELCGMRDERFGSFALGNVASDSLISVLDTPHFQRIYAAIQRGVQTCRASCDYFAVCGGGSPSSKLYENGSFESAETAQCRFSVQATTNVALDVLEERLRDANSASQES